MTTAVLLNFINLFVFVFNLLLLARVLMSWINANPEGGIGGFLVDVTDPILVPIRKVLPRSQMFDFSPLVAFILLQLLAELANRSLAG
jgi:YggT family protein